MPRFHVWKTVQDLTTDEEETPKEPPVVINPSGSYASYNTP